VLRNGRAVAHRKRRIAHRTTDRAPEIDHLHAAFQELIGLIGKMLAHPVRPGGFGLVDMDAGGRLARTGAADVGSGLDAPADGVVKQEDAVGTKRGAKEGFGSWIVDAPDLVLVEEVPDDGRMLYQRKALAV